MPLALLLVAVPGGSVSAATPTCAGKVATIVGTNAANTIRGTGGRDVIVAKGGNDRVIGRGGNDLICGGAGADTLSGSGGNDQLLGQDGDDVLYGNDGNDSLHGGNGSDDCRLGAGAGSVSSCELNPSIIGFESDVATADPLTSNDDPTVHFSSTLHEGIAIGDYVDGNNGGRELREGNDDTSAIEILFDDPTKRLSIRVGNDDPCCTVAGDRATLEVFLGGNHVATVHKVFNRNDDLDQTIVYAGAAIDRAIFVYNRNGTPMDLGEAIDDVTVG
jgi:hypothetical protein